MPLTVFGNMHKVNPTNINYGQITPKDEAVFQFDIDDVYPSNKTSHNHPVYKVGYFDIRVQVRMKWIQFIFTQLKNTPNGLSSGEGVLWRFELSGCLESKAAPSSYISKKFFKNFFIDGILVIVNY